MRRRASPRAPLAQVHNFFFRATEQNLYPVDVLFRVASVIAELRQVTGVFAASAKVFDIVQSPLRLQRLEVPVSVSALLRPGPEGIRICISTGFSPVLLEATTERRGQPHATCRCPRTTSAARFVQSHARPQDVDGAVAYVKSRVVTVKVFFGSSAGGVYEFRRRLGSHRVWYWKRHRFM